MTGYIHSPSSASRLACSLDGRPVAALYKMAAMQEMSFCVLEYAKCSSVASVQRAFLRKYGKAAPGHLCYVPEPCNCPAVYNLMSTAVSRSLRYLSIISCYSHGKSLPSNASLMVGKRVLQGEAWSDLSDCYGTHDFGDHFGDLATNLATFATNR
ncbi:hypothetical protein AVEN_225110-1 [Araneus ventricosus]|uniref:Uncharacterized protein n=1 Tax=Araneus ventricosus TaxID=182803 RepID=A0A4Y2W3J2_ARAVE|nr:hypothetical protein AVEN_225110-1 [Araneus ventricosus]